MRASEARPGVSVVMPTFQRLALLQRTLPPLLADHGAAEVVVVSDGSTDGTVEWLRAQQVKQPRLKVIDLGRSGRQAARRAGLAAAVGEVVLFVDDDVCAAPGMVSAHAEAHRLGGMLVVEGAMPVELGDHPTVPTSLYADEYTSHVQRVAADDHRVLLELWGGNLSMPRALAVEVTAEPDFPASFCEDTHLGIASLRRGAQGRFAPEAAAVHLHRRSLPAFLRDGQQQGAGRWWLHRLYAAELGPLDRGALYEGVPGSLCGIVTAVAVRAHGPIGRLAGLWVAACSRMGWRRAGVVGAKLARRLAIIRGVATAEQEASGVARPDLIATGARGESRRA